MVSRSVGGRHAQRLGLPARSTRSGRRSPRETPYPLFVHRASGGTPRPEAGQGLPEAAARRISQCRAESPFRNVDELAMRAGLNEHELRLLASAGALDALAGTVGKPWRQAAAQRPGAGILQSAPVRETTFVPSLPPASPRRSLPTMPTSASPSAVIRWPCCASNCTRYAS